VFEEGDRIRERWPVIVRRRFCRKTLI